MRVVQLLVAAALLVVAAASADAQYSRPVFGYVNECNQQITADLPNAARTAAPPFSTDAVPSSAGRITVAAQNAFANGDKSASINAASSALLFIQINSDLTCSLRLDAMPTSAIVTWAQEKAALHEGFRRREARLRNLLWLGAAAVFAGTLYAGFPEENGVAEADEVLLLSGTALAMTIGYLGGVSANDAMEERFKRDRYRRFEQQVQAVAR